MNKAIMQKVDQCQEYRLPVGVTHIIEARRHVANIPIGYR
jgi:hypothetical protein